jgi:hypothetical protein
VAVSRGSARAARAARRRSAGGTLADRGAIGGLALPVGAERGQAQGFGQKLALVAVDVEVVDLAALQPGGDRAGTADPLHQHVGGGGVALPTARSSNGWTV